MCPWPSPVMQQKTYKIIRRKKKWLECNKKNGIPISNLTILNH